MDSEKLTTVHSLTSCSIVLLMVDISVAVAEPVGLSQHAALLFMYYRPVMLMTTATATASLFAFTPSPR